MKINKLNSDDYIIFNEVIPKQFIKNFNLEVSKITNSLNSKNSSSKKNLINSL